MGSYDRSWELFQKEFDITTMGEEHFPMLVRVYQDFDFKIVQLAHSNFYLSTRSYLGGPELEVTPIYKSLEALEAHVNANMVDILYRYLSEPCGELASQGLQYIA